MQEMTTGLLYLIGCDQQSGFLNEWSNLKYKYNSVLLLFTIIFANIEWLGMQIIKLEIRMYFSQEGTYLFGVL